MGDADSAAAEKSIEIWKIKKVCCGWLAPSRRQDNAVGGCLGGCCTGLASLPPRPVWRRRQRVASRGDGERVHGWHSQTYAAPTRRKKRCVDATGVLVLVPQLIRGLEAARGNGTSMISLIMHPRDQARTHHCVLGRLVRVRRCSEVDALPCTAAQISKVAAMLANEFGTASNIKNRVNRQASRALLPHLRAVVLTSLSAVCCAVRPWGHHLRAAAFEAVQQGTSFMAMHAKSKTAGCVPKLTVGPHPMSSAGSGATQRTCAVHGDHSHRRGQREESQH